MWADAVLVEYAVEGGYAHQLRSVAVHEDGTLDVVRGGARSSVRWGADQVRALVTELEASGLFGTDHEFPAAAGADLRRHEIRYAGATVVAHDTTVPPVLRAAVSMLEQALTTR